MSKHLVGQVNEIDVKGSRKIRFEETEIAVFKLSDGEVVAVENRCPHKGGLLSEGMVCGHAVHCPLHDWKIDLKTGLVQEPDDGSVNTFKVEVNHSGEVFLEI
ncbi:Assimilatory nitrite reductase [NAD(P)H] small subunit [compost metagenome]